MGRTLGDAHNPLLVSVRSGAKFSMPGMMDTVLNLGLNDKSVRGLAESTQNERFAFDSYRRFISMYGRIVLGRAWPSGLGGFLHRDLEYFLFVRRILNSSISA